MGSINTHNNHSQVQPSSTTSDEVSSRFLYVSMGKAFTALRKCCNKHLFDNKTLRILFLFIHFFFCIFTFIFFFFYFRHSFYDDFCNVDNNKLGEKEGAEEYQLVIEITLNEIQWVWFKSFEWWWTLNSIELLVDSLGFAFKRHFWDVLYAVMWLRWNWLSTAQYNQVIFNSNDFYCVSDLAYDSMCGSNSHWWIWLCLWLWLWLWRCHSVIYLIDILWNKNFKSKLKELDLGEYLEALLQ